MARTKNQNNISKMKTENNLENKSKFFALYFGQRVLMCIGEPISGLVQTWTINNPTKKEYLELKPLESISDEDATVIAKYRYQDPKMMLYTEIGKCIISDYVNRSGNGDFQLEQFEIDYLRSKSYALSWMDLTVQDLIDYGWIKLVK